MRLALVRSDDDLLPGEVVVAGVSKSYGAAQFRKDVVQDCSFTIERSISRPVARSPRRTQTS